GWTTEDHPLRYRHRSASGEQRRTPGQAAEMTESAGG
ncbi:hypothetical protein V3C99_001808, partial [Haemonchus contortus]